MIVGCGGWIYSIPGLKFSGNQVVDSYNCMYNVYRNLYKIYEQQYGEIPPGILHFIQTTMNQLSLNK